MSFFAWNVRGLNSERRNTMTKDWINIHRPLFGDFLETHILENNKESVLGAIPRGWNFFENFEETEACSIIVVWDPSVTMIVYKATAQSVTCGYSMATIWWRTGEVFGIVLLICRPLQLSLTILGVY